MSASVTVSTAYANSALSAEQEAALRTAQAILGAYDRAVLKIPAAYLAETLRMLLSSFAPAMPAVTYNGTATP